MHVLHHRDFHLSYQHVLINDEKGHCDPHVGVLIK